MTTARMNDNQTYMLAEASDLLREFGYESEADLVGRISEQEMTLMYNPQINTNTRKRVIMVNFDLLVDTAKRIVDNTDSIQINSALIDLLSAVQPEARDRLKAYLA